MATSVTDLKPTNHRLSEGSYGRQVVGELRNPLDEPLAGVQIAAALFRRDGLVEYVAVGGLAVDPLPANAAFPFALDLVGLARDFRVDQVELFAEGWRLGQ